MNLHAKIQTFGIILRTEKFDECVHFYRDVLGLPVWYEKPSLVCLRFGDGYLMIETGGHANNGPKPYSQNPTILRFNVSDIDATANNLRSKGVAVERKDFAWGKVAIFIDPDGNICEFRNADDPFFN
jgi:lactoylglutathione lyase